MKFVVDAQLPVRLAQLLGAASHDATHTSRLPDGNRTSDAAIVTLADEEDRVVVTKDRDFRDGHLLRKSPRRLLIVTVGNVSNSELLTLFTDNLETIIEALTEATFVELGPTGLVVHSNPD